MCHPARALRALGLLLADGARNGKSKNRFQGGKLTVMSRAKNGSSTKIGVVWQKSDFLAKNQNFGPKKKEPLLFPYPCSGHDRKKLYKEKSCLSPNNQGGGATPSLQKFHKLRFGLNFHGNLRPIKESGRTQK